MTDKVKLCKRNFNKLSTAQTLENTKKYVNCWWLISITRDCITCDVCCFAYNIVSTYKMFGILIGSTLYGKHESQTLHALMAMNMILRILWNCLIMLMRQKGYSRLEESD